MAQHRVGRSFQGSSFGQSIFSVPDTDAAVGLDHVVELLNGRYAVYRKSDGSLEQAMSLNQFFAAAGVSPTVYAFDPRLLYDAPSGRWFALATDNPAAANSFLLAVSSSSDPVQPWTALRIDSDTNDDSTADFPLLGVSADGVFISANMYSLFTPDVSLTFITIPKADLLLSPPTAGNHRRFENASANGTGYTVQPIVNLDNTGMPHSLMSAYNVPAGALKRSRFTGTIGAPALSTTGGFITVAAATGPPDAPQPPLPLQKPPLDTLDTRFSASVVRRGEACG